MRYLRDLGVFSLGLAAVGTGLWLGLAARVDGIAAALLVLVGLALVVGPPLVRPVVVQRALRRVQLAFGGTWHETTDGGRWGLDLGRSWDPNTIRRFHLVRIDGFQFVTRAAAIELARYDRATTRGPRSYARTVDLVIRLETRCSIVAQVLPRGIVGRAIALDEGLDAHATGSPLDSSFLTLSPSPELLSEYLDIHMNEPLQHVWSEVRLTMPWRVAARVLFHRGGVALLLQGVTAAQMTPETIRRLLGALAPIADRIETR